MGVAERKEREKKQRRKAILEAAEKVFFSKGVEEATMDDVAKAAELSKGTLYLYYKNKEDLLHAIVNNGLDILYNMFEKAVKKEKRGIDKILAVGKAYCEFYREETDYYKIILHQEPNGLIDDCNVETNPCVQESKEKGNRIFTFLREVVEIGIKDGSIRPDLDPMKVAVVLWGHSSGIMHIVAKKGAVLEEMLQVDSGELIRYSLELQKLYLENKK